MITADGVRSDACQRCLVEPEWDALRARLGTEGVRGHRRLEPTLVQNTWTTAAVGTAMFRILAEVNCTTLDRAIRLSFNINAFTA
jgi:hypothetical protein